jgi:hypothetical protein
MGLLRLRLHEAVGRTIARNGQIVFEVAAPVEAASSRFVLDNVEGHAQLALSEVEWVERVSQISGR